MTEERYEIWTCVDCLMMAVNGESNPDWNEEQESAHIDAMEQRLPSDEWLVVPGDDEREFDTCWCDFCGSKLAGHRSQMWAFKK